MKSEILEWCSATHVSTQSARRALAEQYPVIAVVLARQDGNPTLLAINAAIDRGEAIDIAVVTLVGVSPPVVACLENVVPEAVTEAWLECPIELFWALDVLHPLDSPQTPEEWGLLRKLWINTELETHDAYRTAAGIGRARQIVLEYLFRSLCARGYGEHIRSLADRLVAPLLGIETDPERILTFSSYVSFVDEAMTRMTNRGRTESWSAAERLLMRYPPRELIRQWEAWRCVVAAHGDAGFEVASNCDDVLIAHWVLRHVVPRYDEMVLWCKCYPR